MKKGIKATTTDARAFGKRCNQDQYERQEEQEVPRRKKITAAAATTTTTGIHYTYNRQKKYSGIYRNVSNHRITKLSNPNVFHFTTGDCSYTGCPSAWNLATRSTITSLLSPAVVCCGMLRIKWTLTWYVLVLKLGEELYEGVYFEVHVMKKIHRRKQQRSSIEHQACS